MHPNTVSAESTHAPRTNHSTTIRLNAKDCHGTRRMSSTRHCRDKAGTSAWPHRRSGEGLDRRRHHWGRGQMQCICHEDLIEGFGPLSWAHSEQAWELALYLSYSSVAVVVLAEKRTELVLAEIMGDNQEKNGLRVHWKSLLACSLISMSPFQYGVDFTLIGGFQAMVGFLKVILLSFQPSSLLRVSAS